MKFIDEATIEVHAGKGGDGAASFRREKYIRAAGRTAATAAAAAASGPSPTATSTRWSTTVSRGSTAPRTASGPRARIATAGAPRTSSCAMPVGTVITRRETGALVADLATDGAVALLARGGDGGLGNVNFKSSVNRAPRQFTPRQAGREPQARARAEGARRRRPARACRTPASRRFIRAVSSARPKVADYPFTTLHPSLGVVRVGRTAASSSPTFPG